MSAILNLLLLLTVSFTLSNCLDYSDDPVSVNGVNSFTAGDGYCIDVRIGFDIDFRWFFKALQAFLDSYSVLSKTLAVTVAGPLKLTNDLFIDSVNSALALLDDVYVYNFDELYALLTKFLAHISVSVKYGNLFMDHLVKANAQVIAGELRIVLTLLETHVDLITIYLNNIPMPKFDTTIMFETRNGNEFISNIKDTFSDINSLRNDIAAIISAKNNASATAFRVAVYSAIVEVSNVTISDWNTLLNIVFNFNDRLGDVLVQADILSSMLVDEGYSSLATRVNIFSKKIKALYLSSLGVIKSVMDDEIPRGQLGFSIDFETDLAENFTSSIDYIYNMTDITKQVVNWIVEDTKTGGVKEFISNMNTFIGRVNGVRVNDKGEMNSLLEKLQDDIAELVKYGSILSIEFSNYISFAFVREVRYYLSLFYQLQDLIVRYNGQGSSITPKLPTGPNPGGMIISFPYAYEGQMLDLFNGAYEFYLAWKATVIIIIDVHLRSSIASMEASMEAAFNGLFEKPITSLDILIDLVVKFLARISGVEAAGFKLLPQIERFNPDLLRSICTATHAFLGLVGSLNASLAAMLPEINEVRTGTIDTSTAGTTKAPLSDLNFKIEIDKELDQQLASIFNTVYRVYVKFERAMESSSEIQKFEEQSQTFLSSADAVFQSLRDVTVNSEEKLESLLDKVGDDLKTAIANGQKLYQDLWSAGSEDIANEIKLFLGYFAVALSEINSINSNVSECNCV